MAARKTRQVEIEGRAVTISNPEKVFYPETGFTKAEVIQYYVRVSPWLLPHLQHRPITLKRYPEGITGAHFYEKDAPRHTPEWVRTYPVPRRTGGKDIRYVVVDDLATLVWCANLASVEIHPFLHRVPEIDSPTAVVFDLDPGEGMDVLDCARAAFIVREELERLRLRAYPKVSGSKGIQLYVPLNTAVTYDRTQPFARGLAERLAAAHPDLIVAEMSKAVRKRRIFIDWSQNSDFKTTVAVYSLRAKQAEPWVSMPVRWDELREALETGRKEPLYFSPGAAIARLEAAGDLFAEVLTRKQKLPGKSAATAPAARFIEPMRAKLAAALPEGPGWLYEIKLDGYRALAVKNGGEATLWSRNRNLLNSRFPAIASALAALPDGTVLDGEVVALDRNGRPSFNALQNARTGAGPLYYYVFDLPAYRGRELLDVPLSRRREILETEALAPLGDPVRLSETLRAAPADLVAAAREHGLEGIVAKRASSRYEPGARSGAWIKYRTGQGQELVIGGFIPGRNRFDSLLAGYYRGPDLIFAAKLRNGFTARTREEVFRRLEPLLTGACPFANLPEPGGARRGEALTAEVMRKCRWVRPELVAQVESAGWTEAGHLRHARFTGLRDDKDPREVTRETP